MKNMTYKLDIFDEGQAAGAGAAPVGNQPSAGVQQTPAATQQTNNQPGGYSYAQAEEIATARAQKAERAALASYFKQQGMSEDEVTKAIAAYKAAQKAKEPDVATLTRERDEAQTKLAAYEQREALTGKGVKAEYAEFVAFKVKELMAKDSKLDSFEKAAEKYLKDNPQYSSGKPAYRVKSEGSGGGTKPEAKDKEAARAALNAALKSAARRGH